LAQGARRSERPRGARGPRGAGEGGPRLRARGRPAVWSAMRQLSHGEGWILAGACSSVGPVALLLLTVMRGCFQSSAAETEPLPNEIFDESFVAPHGAGKRIAYIDAWRLLCVVAVMVTHSTEVYAEWNVFAVQAWVLPIFIMISGMLFAIGQLPTLDYVVRLLTYFSAGVALNAVAAEWGPRAPEAWWTEFPSRIVCQTAFVLMLAGAGIIASPLRHQLNFLKGSAREVRFAFGYSMIAYASALVCLLVLMFIQWYFSLDVVNQTLLLVSAATFVTLLQAAFYVHRLPEARRGIAGWILLAWIYGIRVAVCVPRPGLEMHLVDLYIWALFVQKVPLRGRRVVGLAMARWWPFLLFACGVLQRPGLKGRFDQTPHASVLERLEQYTPEVAVVLAFTSIPSVGIPDTLQMPNYIKQHSQWLTRWSLFAFISHKAVYYVVQPLPYGLALVVLAAPFFFLLRRRDPPPFECGLYEDSLEIEDRSTEITASATRASTRITEEAISCQAREVAAAAAALVESGKTASSPADDAF